MSDNDDKKRIVVNISPDDYATIEKAAKIQDELGFLSTFLRTVGLEAARRIIKDHGDSPGHTDNP